MWSRLKGTSLDDSAFKTLCRPSSQTKISPVGHGWLGATFVRTPDLESRKFFQKPVWYEECRPPSKDRRSSKEKVKATGTALWKLPAQLIGKLRILHLAWPGSLGQAAMTHRSKHRGLQSRAKASLLEPNYPWDFDQRQTFPLSNQKKKKNPITTMVEWVSSHLAPLIRALPIK